MTNPFGTLRSTKNPYAIYMHILGWEWRVLQTYQSPDDEKSMTDACWLAAVKSEYTFGTYELGDVQAHVVRKAAVLVAATTEWYSFYGKGKPFPKYIRRLKP